MFIVTTIADLADKFGINQVVRALVAVVVSRVFEADHKSVKDLQPFENEIRGIQDRCVERIAKALVIAMREAKELQPKSLAQKASDDFSNPN